MADTAQPASPQDDGPNPFADRLAADPSLGEVSLAERARLNAVEAAYRGTIAGSADLAEFKRALPDQYERITKDLARYETMRGFDGPLEGAVALAGQLGGGMTSPEALITRVPGVNSFVERLVGGVAGRVLGAAGAQATVQGAANPAIQASEIQSGLRKNYSLGENLAAAAGGAVLGGALHGAGEAVGALARSGRAAKVDTDALARARIAEQQAAESRNMAALAAEDPALRPGGGDVSTTAPAADGVDGLPPVPDGFVRMYHGGEDPTSGGSRWATPDRRYARDYGEGGRAVHYVDVPEDHPALTRMTEPEDVAFGIPQRYGNSDLPEDIASGFREVEARAERPAAPAMDAPAVVADPDAAAARAAADVQQEVPAVPQDGAASPQPTAEGVQSAPDSPQSTPATEIPATPAQAVVTSSSGKPLSLSQFIARNGGLALDGEARARDLNRVFVPGGGPLAREKGHSVDGFWREALIEHGYLPPDADGMAARNIERELFDALDREQRGQRQYSAQDRAPEMGGADNQTREIEAQARKITAAAKKVGIRPGDVDQRTMMEAAEMLWRGDADDPLVALEHAMMSGEAGPGQRQQAQAVDGLQFRMKPGALSKVQGALDARPETQAARSDLSGLLRQDGGDVRFRNREPAAAGGEPGRPAPPDAVAGAAAPAETPAAEPLRSLQQQAQDLADALDVPLRQGRVQGGKVALGQFRNSDEVMRVRNVADFETVAHEAGHALEKRVGEPLSDLIDRHAAELGPLDYDPQRGDAGEGFAEWVRTAMFNPAAGQRQAPGFTQAFRALMQREAPDLLERLDQAVAAHQAYLAAPTGEKLATMVRKPEEDGVIASIKREGIPQTIRIYMTKWYEGLSDEKAPVNRAVRELARQIKAKTGEVVNLQGADNPELLVRAFSRAKQAAVQDMREGVRPYHGVVPEGPSLHDAIATATGVPSNLGRWNEEAVAEFNRYIVARRAEVLYRRFEAGELERRPIALSADEVRASIAEMEAANPGFRAGADQFHQYTRQLLRKQYEGGLIDADLFGRLMDEEFYAPLYRHMDERPEGLRSGAGGSDGPGTVDTIKRLRGSDRDIVPPIDSMMTQTFLVNRTVQHNDIIKSFVALARQAREVGASGVGRILEEIPPTQMLGQRFDLSEAVQSAARRAGTDGDDLAVLNGALTDVFGSDPIMATIFRSEPTGKRGEPLVFYKDGGQLRAVRMISADEGMGLYEAVSELPPVAKDWALAAAISTSQLTRAAVTSDPTFAISNFIRDQLATAIYRPDYIPFISGLRGIKSEITQDNIAGMYAYAGGMSPGTGAAGLTELMDHDINALARKGWAVQKLGGLGDLMRGDIKAGFVALAETIATAETATRLAVFEKIYKQKLRQGLSPYDAMQEAGGGATDLMDFSRRGSRTVMIRTLVPFLNAWKEGLDKNRRTIWEPLYRAARGDIVTSADAEALKNAPLALAKFAAGLGAVGTMYGLWASDYEAYRDASPELRATNWIVPGAAFGFAPNSTLLVPKPFELALFNNVAEMAGVRIATGDPRTAGWAVSGIYDVLAPPNLIEGIPGVKTYFELKTNRSTFTGKDIVKEQDQNKEHPELEYNDRTSSLAKAIGGAIGVSPIKVDYAVGSMFSTMGRNVLAASNTTNPDAPDASSDDTMFLKRWAKNADRTSETTKLFWEQAAQRNGTFAQARDRYAAYVANGKLREAYDYLGQMPASQRTFVMLAQGGDEDTGKSVFNADDRRLHPINRAATAVQTVGGLIKDLTANRQETFEDQTPIKLTPTQRRDIIDNLRVLQAMEQRNALVMSGEKGYAGRPLLSTEDQYAVLKAMSPVIANEVATRYATAKILPTDTVAKLWPEAQRRLLADGTQAEIRDLALDAKVDGWAFDGDAVRKPQRRRVSIDPTAPPPPRSERRIPPALSVPNTTPVPNPFN